MGNAFIYLIEFGILLVSLASLFWAIKTDNRKLSDRVLQTKMEELEKFANLEKRVELLEQKVDLSDEYLREEMDNIKGMLLDLSKKV